MNLARARSLWELSILRDGSDRPPLRQDNARSVVTRENAVLRDPSARNTIRFSFATTSTGEARAVPACGVRRDNKD